MIKRIMIEARMFWLLAMLLCNTALSGGFVHAQDEPTSTPDPNGQPVFDVPSEIQATHDAESAIFIAQYKSRTIFDFRVAYLIAEDTDTDGTVVSSAHMAKYLGAEIIHDWDEFLSLNEDERFHMILIHGSMAEQVDPEWMGNAYRNDVQVVGIDMLPKTLKSLVRDKGVRGAQRRIAEWYEHYLFYFTYHVELENESYRDHVYERQLEHCKRIEIEGYGSFTHGVMNRGLTDDKSIQYLAETLLINTVAFDIPNPNNIKTK